MSTMKSAQTVYYGPSTSTYPSLGSVSASETVTALWYEGNFVFIEYSVTGTSQKKRGYVGSTTVTVTESISTKTVTLTSKTVSSGATTYTGPNISTYANSGSVSTGETVYAILIDGTFTFIEYNITGSTQKKRAYVASSALATSPSGSVPTVGTQITTFPSSCYGSGTPFYPTYVGECTWYCWGRAKEVKGKTNLPTGNAGDWYAAATAFTRQATPVPNSIAVWTNHVAYVEAVINGEVYFTEANWYPGSDARRDNGRYESLNTSPAGTDGVVQKPSSITDFKGRSSGSYLGCIVL